MKKSFLFSVIMLAAVPVYMAFIVSRSPKNDNNMSACYKYHDIGTITVDPMIAVWFAASDTNFLRCEGCDTTGIYNSGNLLLDKPGRGLGMWVQSLSGEIQYQVGLKNLFHVMANNNVYYITSFRQSKMELTITYGGEIALSECELDTLIVYCHGAFGGKLTVSNNSRIKHIIIDSKNETGDFFDLSFSIESSQIEALDVKNIDENTFKLSAPASILRTMNFTLNNKQVTGAAK